MPELPEVETTRRGIEPHLADQFISAVVIRQPMLRWPIPSDIAHRLAGKTVRDVSRRAKYLLLRFDHGTLIIHLGMSGSLRLCEPSEPYRKHDHVELCLESGRSLRFHDPRRFGAILWTDELPEQHVLLQKLGPEPLSPEFDGDHLYDQARSRRAPIKQVIMDQKVVVGVGNIYATEALFAAGIDPRRAANRIAKVRMNLLAEAIQSTLARAIESGGSTLRDFVNSNGQPGYFQQTLQVYGRAGQDCQQCGQSIRSIRIGQRASCYCPHCQK